MNRTRNNKKEQMAVRVISVPSGYNNPFDYNYRYGYTYPYSYSYSYPYSYSYGYNYPYTYNYPLAAPQPSFYGTCGAVAGVVVRDNCLGGTRGVSVPGTDACYCQDDQTGWKGCGNTANGFCMGPAGSPIVYNASL